MGFLLLDQRRRLPEREREREETHLTHTIYETATTRYKIQDTRNKIDDSRFTMQDTRYKIYDPSCTDMSYTDTKIHRYVKHSSVIH